MVNRLLGASAPLTVLLLAQQQPKSPLKQLDAPVRAKIIAAFAVLLILGFGLMFLAWLGARATRRYMNAPPRRRLHEHDQEDWARKPIVPADRRRNRTDD